MLTNSPKRSRMLSDQHRVLIYATCYNVLDGVTLTIRKLEQEILAAGHSVCILSTASGDPANTNLGGTHPNRRVIFMDNGVPIPFVADPNNPDVSYQLGFSISAAVRAEIEDFEASIIHITCPDCTALHLIQYARCKEIPIMGTYHSNIPEYMDHYPGLSWLKHILGAFFRHQYNFLQALYVPTPYIQKHLIDRYKMDSATSLGIWGRGVDTQQFHPHHRSFKYRHSLGIPDDTVVLCWVGRFVPEKRPDIFAHVVQRLHAQNENFHALVIGAGPSEDDLKYLPNTTFCGWMNADQLAVAYASSDILLFPSAVETFGNVTLEAAASGLPVVVEAGCSGHLVVPQGEKQQINGFACPAGDVEAFFDATLQLLRNDKLRYAAGLAGRQLAESLEKRAVVQAMLDHYSRVTDQFYTEYGGHHANRDRVYRKPDSFVAGNHPRPLLLVMVEYLFIVLFQVIWNMTNMFMYMQEGFLLSFGGMLAPLSHRQRHHVVMPDEATIAASHTASTSGPSAASRRRQNQRSNGGTIENGDSDENDNGVWLIQAIGDGDGPAIVELSDVEIGASSDSDDSQEQNALLITSSSLSDDDDDTDAGSSSTTSTKDETAAAQSFCCAPMSHSAFGDCQLSHALAKGFVRSVQIQCRMESHFRNACSSSWNPARATLKRKNSSFALQDHHELEAPTTRGTTRSPEVSAGAAIAASTCTVTTGLTAMNGEGHRLRRQRDPLVDNTSNNNNAAAIRVV